MRQTGSLGPNIRRVRHARMTVERLARRLDWDPGEIECIERGQALPTIGMVMQIAQALELDLQNRQNLLDCHRSTTAMWRAHGWTTIVRQTAC